MQSSAVAHQHGAVGSNRRFRIALSQGNPSPNHVVYLQSIAARLMEQSWLEEQPVPDTLDSSLLPHWQWLSQLNSPHIEFLKDPVFIRECPHADLDADDATQVANPPLLAMSDYISDHAGIDLVLAFGVDDQTGLARDNIPAPFLAVGVNSHTADYLLDTLNLLDAQNLYLHKRPEYMSRNIALFNDVVGFRRLGIIHASQSRDLRKETERALEKAAGLRGVKVKHCYADSNCGDINSNFVACCKSLLSKVDAIYIEPQPGFNDKTVVSLVDLSRQYRVPTCYMGEDAYVKKGIFMCTTITNEYRQSAQRVTANMQSILRSKSGQHLVTETQGEYQFYLNMRTAESIGVYLSADVLAAADEIHVDLNVE